MFIDWYLPGFRAGGPVQSLSNLVEELPCTFWIVTSVYDHACATPYSDIVPNTWVSRRNNENVMYLSTPPSRSTLKQLVTSQPFDRIYINSLFSLHYAIRPLMVTQGLKLAHKVILAPRGMLKQGALSVKSAKKKAFIRVSRLLRLFNGITWAATNDQEAREITRTFGSHCLIRLAPNLPRKAEPRAEAPDKLPGVLRLYTVARVSPEKNFLGGIDYLSKLGEGQVEWHIYGTLHDEAYLASCRQAALKTKHLTVNFIGELPPDQIAASVANFHFMYLPTLGENFGHSIAEAFGMSIPVIISDRTPWRSLSERMAGWDLPLDGPHITDVLHLCLNMDHPTYLKWCAGAQALGRRITTDESAKRANVELFCSEP